MLKTQPLCIIAKSNLREFQMKYKALLLCQAKGDTTGSCPEKLCPNLGRFDEEFYSNGLRAELLIKDYSMHRTCPPLIWPQGASC